MNKKTYTARTRKIKIAVPAAAAVKMFTEPRMSARKFPKTRPKTLAALMIAI